jgi:hypothetical protein
MPGHHQDINRSPAIRALLFGVAKGSKSLTVKLINESTVVDPPQEMNIPKRHWVDALGVFVLPNAFLIDICNCSRGRIQLWFQCLSECCLGSFRHIGVQLTSLVVALLNDLAGALRLSFEKVNPFDHPFEKAFDNIQDAFR